MENLLRRAGRGLGGRSGVEAKVRLSLSRSPERTAAVDEVSDPGAGVSSGDDGELAVDWSLEKLRSLHTSLHMSSEGRRGGSREVLNRSRGDSGSTKVFREALGV